MSEKETLESLEDHPVYGAPGLGLASYSCLLLIFFLIGVFGVIMSTASLFQAFFPRSTLFTRSRQSSESFGDCNQ